MSARLHHDRVVHPGNKPARWLLFTHGIYGAGGNWRAIARKLVERRPEWGVVLVDLRLHGRSEAGEPPHTLAACADDLRALVSELALPVQALAGHSFGGKVMLVAREQIAVDQTWVLDASPSAQPDRARGSDDEPGSPVHVLALMESLPRSWLRRDDFVAALVAAGQTQALAQWLAMNLVPDPSGAYTLRFDLVAIRALLSDYFVHDLWSSVFDPSLGDVELVRATRSSSTRDLERPLPPHVHLHRIDASHWMNVDAPGAIVDMFVRGLG